MFIIDLVPLILGDLCSCRKIYKNNKNQALEAIGARQGHHGPLGGVG
jgi:hypothetical protein